MAELLADARRAGQSGSNPARDERFPLVSPNAARLVAARYLEIPLRFLISDHAAGQSGDFIRSYARQPRSCATSVPQLLLVSNFLRSDHHRPDSSQRMVRGVPMMEVHHSTEKLRARLRPRAEVPHLSAFEYIAGRPDQRRRNWIGATKRAFAAALCRATRPGDLEASDQVIRRVVTTNSCNCSNVSALRSLDM